MQASLRRQRRTLPFLFLGLFVGAILVRGQDTADGEDDGEVFYLSPFEVITSEDMGYLANNSVSGTRLAAKIRDLPMSLEVLTPEYLNDIGATAFKESLSYTSGIFTFQTQAPTNTGLDQGGSAVSSPSGNAGVGNFRNNAISIRGFNAPFQLRHGFRIGGYIPSAGINLGGITDTVSMKRVEIVRGPQSLLYGLSVISGIANILPKRPLSEPQQNVRLSAGSWNYLRGELDVTGPTHVKGLNYRAFAASENSDDWQDYRSSSKDYLGFQLEYLPAYWLKIFTEVQLAHQVENGIGPSTLRDSYNEDEFTYNWDFRNEFGEYVDWVRDPNYGDKSPGFKWSGPDTYYDREEVNVIADLEIRPLKEHDLVFKTGVLYGEQDIEERVLRWGTNTNRNGIDNLRLGIFNPEQGKVRPLDPSIAAVFRNPPDLKPPYPVPAFPATAETELRDTDDLRSVWYYYELRPTVSDSVQVRVELTYSIDTDFLFGTRAEHNFLLGRTDIRDEVDYTFSSPFLTSADFRQPDREDNPYRYKNPLEMTPIRYEGNPYPNPGRDYKKMRVWFRGHYLVYNGSLFDDRVNLIAGMRYDSYNSWEGVYDRVQVLNPNFEPGRPPEERINPEYDPFNPNQLRGLNEDKTIGHLFEEDQEEETAMAALSYRMNDDLSIYGMYAEGISPNTGQKDGNFEAIPAERTTSTEIGLKFELLEGKISGSVALWQIDRENVTWAYEYAPNPGRWKGGRQLEVEGVTNPNSIFDYDEPITYWVHSRYFDDLGVDYTQSRRPPFGYPEGIEDVISDPTSGERYVLIEYDKLDEAGLREVIETAWNDAFELPTSSIYDYSPSNGVPMLFSAWYNQGNNASISTHRQTNYVPFEDVSRGVDFNVILSPLENWQVIMNYSYIEREVTQTFTFPEAYHPETGKIVTTEYDVWNYFLGREAFEDPKDPTTLTGGINGLSLFFAPQHSASLWNKYSFREGLLEGLSIGGGIKYLSESSTSIPIGGRVLSLNPYRTPPVPERITIDALLAYQWEMFGHEWKAQLNLYNLSDDTDGSAEVSYKNDEGDVIKRRIQRYYAPLHFRISLGASF